ncbi:MAG: tetratricopeptide repeat protein [Sphingobacteriaceae bacterium]|nr:tetratricopeptide repeat protein [Cytophagaceae bacterium]
MHSAPRLHPFAGACAQEIRTVWRFFFSNFLPGLSLVPSCMAAMLLVGIGLRGLAQTPKDPLERRQAEVKAHPQPDTLRVRLLNALAEELRAAGKLSRARDAAQQALDLAQRLADPSGQTAALLLLGQFWAKAGDLQTALDFFREAEHLARQHQDWASTAEALRRLSDTERQLGNYAPALDYVTRSLTYAQRSGQRQSVARSQLLLGMIYVQVGEYEQAMPYLNLALTAFRRDSTSRSVAQTLNIIGEKFRHQGNLPEALRFFRQSIALHRGNGDSLSAALIGGNLAYVYEKQGRRAEALAVARQAFDYSSRNESSEGLAWIGSVLGRIHLGLNRPDSALFYARQSLRVARSTGGKEYSRDASQVLAETYARRGNWAEAYRYQALYVAFRDSVSGEQTQRRVAALRLNQELDKKQTQIALIEQKRALQADEVRQQRLLLVLALVALGLALSLALGLGWLNRQRRRSNGVLEQQKRSLQAALNDLQTAQNQLVQSEKMASLGELTAGIAHEIQNPLNFVNNFSEVSVELLEELKEEREKGPGRDEGVEGELLDDLAQNLQKITQHGQRASSIVRGMLEHSRSGSLEKQPTDLNALADEYLRLAYHGLRARDKTFNAELKTNLDPRLGKVRVVPQDLGRVLLNLLNNAFYAVQQRQQAGQPDTAGQPYQPTVTLSVRKVAPPQGAVGIWVEIKVKDNGTGMPQAVKQKIFQPFFTTKPTGQGTGLGLSLAYDIVTKGHGGTLRVESTEGVGTEIRVQLPA